MTSQISIEFIDIMLHSKFEPNRTGSFWQTGFWRKWQIWVFQHPTAPLEKVDPDGEHNVRRYYCPDDSDKKWFQLDWTLREDDFVLPKKGPPWAPLTRSSYQWGSIQARLDNLGKTNSLETGSWFITSVESAGTSKLTTGNAGQIYTVTNLSSMMMSEVCSQLFE